MRALIALFVCAAAVAQTNVVIRVDRADTPLAIFGREYSRWTVTATNTTTNRLEVGGVILYAKAQQTPPVPGGPPRLRIPSSEPRITGWTWNDGFLDRGVSCSCLRTVDLQAIGQAEMMFDGRQTKDGKKGYGYINPKESVQVGEWFAADTDAVALRIGEFPSYAFGPDGAAL